MRGYKEKGTGLSVETLKRAFLDNLFYVQGKFRKIASKNDLYLALAYTVRDRQLHRWINTVETCIKAREPKIVCYLSAEFLLGPRLGNSLINLGISGNSPVAAVRYPPWLTWLRPSQNQHGVEVPYSAP
ncbi:MAG: hypothetical protein JO251_03590 [Verrucomicrobia bacterium]|nr:hypothetical protein [Verrucomicrobiota bacterium]